MGRAPGVAANEDLSLPERSELPAPRCQRLPARVQSADVVCSPACVR